MGGKEKFCLFIIIVIFPDVDLADEYFQKSRNPKNNKKLNITFYFKIKSSLLYAWKNTGTFCVFVALKLVINQSPF